MQDAVAGNKRRERKQLHPRRLPFFARAHETRFAAADDSDDGSGRCEAGCTVKKVCMGSSAVEADTGTLLATMRRMFEEVEESMTDKTDVCFRLSDGEMVHAHKCVVTSACLFIRCCMEAGMKEEKTGVIDATICDKATLLGILEYMYTGSIRIEKRSEVNILDVLHVQDQWNVSGLGMWAVSTADERCITGILEYCLDTGNGDLKESALIAVSDNEKLDECDFKGVKAEVVQWLMSNLKMGAYTCGMALADKWINQNIGVATPSDYEVIGNAVDLRRLKLNELTQIHRSEMFGSSEAVQKKFSDAISSRSGLQGEWKKDSKIDIVVATTVKAAEGKRDETNRHVVNISPTLVGFFYRHSVSIVDSRGALVNHFSKSDVPWMRIVHACRHPSSDGFIVLTSSTWGNENRWKSHFFVCDVQFKVLHKIVVSPDALFVQASQKGVVYVLDKDTGLWAYDMNTWKLIRLIVQCEDIGFSGDAPCVFFTFLIAICLIPLSTPFSSRRKQGA